MSQQLIEQIDAILPQTQCGKCGFPGCRLYAEAIAEGRADINQCPPGDQEGIQKLAELLGVPPKPLNTSHGFPRVGKVVAWIDERICIGCTFCVQSCPVDAIVGAAKQMHIVIAAECTGCELCIAPCPMDCISLIPIDEEVNDSSNLPVDATKKQAADRARARYQFRQQRLERDKQINRESLKHKNTAQPEIAGAAAEARKKTVVQAAIKRAMAIRTQAIETNSPIKPHELS
ncbi:RnfABCDGE type electron transport complex subunit B [Nitrosomonas sp. Nm166]|uniref:RnfABCDGE type electron transport complex subunit B n=1 Tax=Nitrosomonas sp. Nm166 TaxID=1881054 RepID=UPI0008E358D4|nr:RnfABCDGE type electron transport complex subunit B [Nitrosomonas sp. Nm166]SFE57949.1 electron transport complex protein RnfB [Nitrosomonas sp. Nm166]